MIAIRTMTEMPVTLYGYMLIYCNAAGFPIENLEIRHHACPLVEVKDDCD